MGFTVTTNGTNPWDFVETVVNNVKKIYKTIYVHVFESFSVLQDALQGLPLAVSRLRWRCSTSVNCGFRQREMTD